MKAHGLRGSDFENRINQTLSLYREKKLALIQKIPTPITPINLDKKNMHITLAYFNKKSTVDYIGVVQEIPVCFDAKECTTDIFRLSNIHKHQYQFMKEFEEQGGISFLLVLYSKKQIVLYLPFRKLEFFINRAKSDKKSFNIDEIDDEYFINVSDKIIIPFLDKLEYDLNNR